MIDSIPLWFAIPAIVIAWVWLGVAEFRESQAYWAARDAADPVVVTGSGHRSNRYPRSCGGVR
jgi:hypothetical protein